MNKFVLLAVVGFSLAVFMHASVSEEPFQTAAYQTKQANDFGAAKAETVDSTADKGFDDDLNDEYDFNEVFEEDDNDDEDEEEEDDSESDSDVREDPKPFWGKKRLPAGLKRHLNMNILRIPKLRTHWRKRK